MAENDQNGVDGSGIMPGVIVRKVELAEAIAKLRELQSRGAMYSISALEHEVILRMHAVIAAAYLAEHPADDEEPLSFAWIEEEYRHLLRTYGAVGVALILLRKEGEIRWELAVWPMLGGKSDCDLRIVFGDRNVQYTLGLPSLKTRGDLRRLLETLLETVKTK